jgi:hypothetical protein
MNFPSLVFLALIVVFHLQHNTQGIQGASNGIVVGQLVNNAE